MGLWNQWSASRLDEAQDVVLRLVEERSKLNNAGVTFTRQTTQLAEAGGSVPGGVRSCKSGRPSSRARTMHSIECRSSDCDESKPPVLLMHGYGAGGLLFAGNMSGMASASKRRVIAVDWLGCGASGRPEFSPKTAPETISWFLDAFEEWVEVQELEKFDLVAHSLGAYLSAKYVLRGGHEKVEHFVMASPAGIAKPPPDWRQGLPAVGVRLWTWGVNPNHIVRTAGPFGRGLVEKVVKARLGTRKLGVPSGPDSEAEAGEVKAQASEEKAESGGKKDFGDGALITDYLHQTASAPDSGEHALSAMLLPGAWAKLPLADELPKVKVPLLIVYGDRDWLARDISAAEEVTEAAIAGGVQASVQVVKGTHHVYLEDHFDGIVLDFFSGVGSAPRPPPPPP